MNEVINVKTKKRIIVRQLDNIISQYFSCARECDSQERDEYIHSAYIAVDEMLCVDENTIVSGDADDFHNLAVTFAKEDDYETALDIVKMGLSVHKSNTDILADAVKYGSMCGEYEDCDKYCESLYRITKRKWTWRAFSFLIDYIIDSIDRREYISDKEIEIEKDKALGILSEYQQRFYDYEDAWYSEFDIYWKLNERERAKEILSVLSKKSTKYPKILVKYADIMIDEKNYSEAEKILEPLIHSSDCTAYAYYLYGNCQLDELLKIESKSNLSEDTEEKIQNAYRSYYNAWVMSDQRLQNEINNFVKRLFIEFQIYPIDKYNIDEWNLN